MAWATRRRGSTAAPRRSRARPATCRGRDAWVGGSIGPLGPPTRELRHPDDATIRSAFREQIDGLLEGGVDLLVIETFFDLHHLLLAVSEARAAADVPVIASMTFGEDLVLADGTTPEEARIALRDAGVDAIGVNCGVGPIACLDALGQLGLAGEGRAGALRDAQCRPADSAPRAASCTPRNPRTSAASCPACSTPGRRSSGAAAARPPSTSRRCAPRSTPSPPPTSGAPRRSPRRSSDPGRSWSGRRASPPWRRRRRAPAAPSRPASRGPSRTAASWSRRDRPAPQHPHRPHAGRRPAPARVRRRHRQHQRLGDGPRADGRDVGGVRDPARRRPRVRGPHDDPRPEPDGAGVGAARRACARRAQHPGAHRRPAAGRRLSDRDGRVGRRLDRADRGAGRGSTGARTRRARPSASRPVSRSSAPSTPRRTTPRPSGTGSSASWPAAPSW